MADENLYSKQIGFAYWLATRMQMIKTVISIILIVVIVFFAGLNLYLLIFNFGIYGRAYNDFLNGLLSFSPEYIQFKQTKLPLSINIGQIDTLPNNANFDIIANISNPNRYWYAIFNYQFKIGNELTASRSGFLLPGENKKLLALNIEGGNAVSELVFSDLNWIKEINYQSIAAEKLNIEIENIVLIPPSELGLGDKLQVSQVKFDAVNNSDFNYANVAFQVYLLNTGKTVAVGQISSGILKSGQAQTYQLNFFQTLSRVNEISVIPEINILDPDVFIKF